MISTHLFSPARAALVLATALAGAGTGCQRQQAREEEPPAPRITANRIVFAPQARELTSLAIAGAQEAPEAAVRFHGRLAWDENATVRVFSPFAGRVTAVSTELGANVDKDAPMAMIASPDFGQAQADARKAETDLAQAERNLSRLRELLEHGAAAAKDVAATEAECARARAEAERSRGRLALYGASSETIDNNYHLKCPIAGVIVERNVSVGQEVRPDQMLAGLDRVAAPLFIVTDPARLWAHLDVPEADLARVHRGQTIHIRSTTLAGRTFAATVDVIADALDPLARTARVRASVPNADRLLKSEMLVTGDVTTQALNAVQVPAKAVFHLGEAAYVFAQVTPVTFERRAVRIGGSQENSVQILNGLLPGENVVADGALLLEQLLERQEGPASGPAAAPSATSAPAGGSSASANDYSEAVPHHDVAVHNPPVRSPGRH